MSDRVLINDMSCVKKWICLSTYMSPTYVSYDYKQVGYVPFGLVLEISFVLLYLVKFPDG